MNSVLPQVAPYPASLVYTDMKEVELTTTGDHFIAGMQCIFEATHFKQIVIATVLSENVVKCKLPQNTICRKLPCFITTRLALILEDHTVLKLHGQAYTKLYAAPLIEGLHPNRGVVKGGTEVIVTGLSFNLGFGNLYCLFGDSQV